MFLAEVLLGIIAPVVLLIIPRIRGSHFSLFVASVLVVLGFIMNRLNVSITGMEGASGNYFPSWTEVSVTSMIVVLGFVLFSSAVRYLPVFPPDQTEESKEQEDGRWLAPNVLRQPLFSSTTLALVLGGVFLGSSLLLGGNGLWYRMRMKNVSASKALSPPSFADRHFTMPADITLPRADTSPGVVTFRHSSHLDAKQPNCTQCHVQHFRILKMNVRTGETAGPRDLHSEQFCGSCHNGQKSFSVQEDCNVCHSM
jgi:c(7)-type cytochrome triheme protein